MIDWLAVKNAYDVSLQEIPMDYEGVSPFYPKDKKLLESTMRVILKASGQPSTKEDINDELIRIVDRGKPYRILEDGKPVGIGVTGHFSHYDASTKRNYEGQSINDLGLLPKYQGHGTGKEALRLLVSEMMKNNPKWLHIAHANSNTRAGNLYRSQGFGRPMAWDEESTSLHMKGSEAKKLLKQWAKEKAVVKQSSERPYLYLGTTNPGKIREMSDLLSSLGVEPRTLDSLPDVEETGRSYRANALLKAKAAALRGVPVLSEDSGLSVRALNGAPGLHSGRYSGNANHNSADNASKLLEALKGIKDRRAAFVTAAAIADGGNTITATRRKPGLITDTPRGDKGFSYDTVFVPEGSNQTYAESGDKSDSSRDRAVRAVVEKYLNKQAADVAAPDEGLIDNNRKRNPVPVDPMKQIRNQAFQQKMVEVPKAYAKGVAQDVANSQAWRDAVESVGTQWNRAWHGRKPYAHMLYKGPLSAFGKYVADKGEKYGWMTPQQARQQRATWDWWTQPQREQIAEVEKRFPYSRRLEENPYYKPFGQLAPEFISAAGVNEVMKTVEGIPRYMKNVNNAYGEVMHKQRILDRWNRNYPGKRPHTGGRVVNKTFKNNNLPRNEFQYSGTVTANQLKQPESYSKGAYVRNTFDNENVFGTPMQGRTRDLTARNNRLWGSPTGGWHLEKQPGSSFLTMDDRYLQKWENGDVLINADSANTAERIYKKVLQNKGIKPEEVLEYNYKGDWHNGDPRLRKAIADYQRLSPDKSPWRHGDDYLGSLEVVREVPNTPGIDPVADIIDFIPDGTNAGKTWPVFTRKGRESALRGVLKNTGTVPVWPDKHKMGVFDSIIGRFRGKTVPPEAYK